MILNSIILGIVEGLTEFLPVSSTGHLIIVNKFISFSGEFANLFDVVIQMGAIFAVMIYFYRKIFPFGETKNKVLIMKNWLKILIAFIPSAVLGYIFADKIEEKLFNPITVAIALIIGGVLLLLAEEYASRRKKEDIDEVSIRKGLWIGLFQCLALIPGMSRSGSTIIGGFFAGLSRKAAAEFSFLLAVPTILGASAYKILKYQNPLSRSEIISLSIGTVTSFIVAFLVISLFMNYIRNKDLKIFAYYRILLGVIVLIFIK